MLGPRVLTVADVEALADVPPRDVLLARLAGGFQAPLVKAAGLFQAFTRNFAYGLKAYIDTRPARRPSRRPRRRPAGRGRRRPSRGSRDRRVEHRDAPKRDDADRGARRPRPSRAAETEQAETESEATTGEAN